MLLQLNDFLSSLLLLIVFAMLAQRRVQSLLHLFIWQGVVLSLSIACAAIMTNQIDLAYSALLTLLLKVVIVPIILQRLINKLEVKTAMESLVNLPTVMLLGIGLVILSFSVVLPSSLQFNGTLSRPTLEIALACVLIAFLMLITRRQAISQVIAFLTIENGLIFAAVSNSGSMPLIVELGIAFDVLIATLIFGVFFLQIRTAFDSLDIERLEKIQDLEV